MNNQSIDWSRFIPGAGLEGGALIGLAVAGFALFNGRIAGISGIVGGLLRPRSREAAWRMAFVLGLLAAPWVWTLVGPLPPLHVEAGTGALVAAGVLVGFGTRLGSGCTSGHGVCGVSRGSPRSLVATAAFMGTGFATVYVMRHLLGL